MSETFIAVLFGFTQAIATGEAPVQSAPDFDAAINQLKQHRTLRAETVLTWPGADRLALIELLKAWIVVLEGARAIGNPLPLPTQFCEGSSSTRLGPQVVAEILHRNDQLQAICRRTRKARSDRPN